MGINMRQLYYRKYINTIIAANFLVLILYFLLCDNLPKKLLLSTYQKVRCSEDAVENRVSDDPNLLRTLQNCFLMPPSRDDYNLSNVKVRNDPRIHEFVNKTFHDVRNGFFIEAGAVDGEHWSNTLWLEKTLNWTGLLIEVSPKNCVALMTKHRKAWFSCSCISGSNFAKSEILEIPIKKDGSYSQVHNSNPRLKTSFFSTYNDIIMKTSNFSYTKVQCFPLSSYLLALNVTKVDFVSLDTQGGEAKMMANFPFDKIKVRYMVIEHANLKTPHRPSTHDKDFVDQMIGKGYDLMQKAGWDYFFRKKEEDVHRV